MDTQPNFASNIEQHLARAQPQTSRSTKKHKHTVVKRTVKYLSVCTNPQTYRAVVRAAPDSVIKAIVDAAYNVERGDVTLTPSQRALFRTHRRAIAALTSSAVGLVRKRKVILSQKGGFAFLPILIGSALGALGSRLFGGSTSNQ